MGLSACISAWHERPGRSAPVKRFYSVVGITDKNGCMAVIKW